VETITTGQPATITAGKIAEILGRPVRTVQRWAAAQGWEVEGSNGRGVVYLINRLPAEIQERIARHRMGIDEEAVGEMARRFEIRINPEQLRDPAVASKIRMVCECLAVAQNARGRDKRITEIAGSYGYHRGTAYRLIKRVKEGKPLSVSTKNYGTRIEGLGTVRAWDEGAARMAVEAIMENRRNHAEKLSIYKDISLRAQGAGLKIGSYGSFLNLSRKIDPSVIVYRDKGIRGLREDIVPAIRRDPTAYRPMECLVGDQHKADYYCLDHNGDVATLELFCWLDFRTQLIWGAIAYKHYNRYTVGQALLNAVRWGLPSMLYTDWGKPEESNYINLLVEQITGLGIRAEEIRRTRAMVRHPQAKPIEGWFGWLDRNLRNERLPGYCKRLRDVRENDLQQKEVTELIRAGRLLFIDDLVERVLGVIEGWNAHLFKNRGKDTGRSPLQIYNEETVTYPVTAISEEVLDYIFLPMQETKVSRSQVKVRHEFLKKTITYYDAALADHGGEQVVVRYSPFDVNRVWVFTAPSPRPSPARGEGEKMAAPSRGEVEKEIIPARGERGNGRAGRLICQAEEWGMINPKSREHVMERMQQQRHLVKVIKEKYEHHAPDKKPIPRIHPQQQQAREMVRVMRTQIEEQEEVGGLRLEVGGGSPPGGCAYRKLEFVKSAEPERMRPLFAVNMDREEEE